MSDKITQSSSVIDPFSSSIEISSKSVSQQIEQFEIKFLKALAEYNGNSSTDIQINFERIQNMLNFAKDNFEKGFVNVSKSCLTLAENYLDKCQ